ncbi:MAG: hypothetical protein Q8M29_17395 [Bacteroidota bacterium]|nr:hypothetical protein [Bacteroidota bacterium]
MKKYQLHYSSEQQGSFDAGGLEEEAVKKGSGTNVMLIIFTIAVITFVAFAIAGLKG